MLKIKSKKDVQEAIQFQEPVQIKQRIALLQPHKRDLEQWKEFYQVSRKKMMKNWFWKMREHREIDQ